ncbi:uncharacterized protein LOC142985943 [Anticarsia gemmatalis]|uniref:uncharacterized protein LOC142985943 n=1 Tax=Anticarsia gemmatalis TaxID=129554 RepID=UPI003F758D40
MIWSYTAWLNSHPSRWKTFVANRTSEILNVTDSSQWFHVSSANNPADCASRGLLPNLLVQNQIWFSGPSFLGNTEIVYSRPKDLICNLEQSIKTHVATIPVSIIDRFSSLTKLLRVVSYCRRFSPNFGGLWESGVKSTKFHLKRVIGESTLTYEELSTLLTQVEACLNSRPISIISSTDSSEPLPLTPGHFLIGEPLINVPDVNYEGTSVGCLTRWQFVQRMLQSFWRRWSNEYLSNLMNRYKWSVQVPEPNVDDIVLLKEDDLPPCRWSLGRVIQKHPGQDNITRVVTLRTKSSTLKRPTSKLCILPIAQD